MGITSKTRGKTVVGTIDNLSDPQDVTRSATVTLTAAQVKALYTTPQVIIPAPGASKAIALIEVYAKHTFLTTAFAGSNKLEFRYTSSNGAKVTADMDNAILLQTATAYRAVKAVVTDLVPVLNAPIVVDVPSADPTQGLGSLKLTAFYRVVTP